MNDTRRRGARLRQRWRCPRGFPVPAVRTSVRLDERVKAVTRRVYGIEGEDTHRLVPPLWMLAEISRDYSVKLVSPFSLEATVELSYGPFWSAKYCSTQEAIDYSRQVCLLR